MAKKPKNEEQVTPEAEAPKRPQAVIKVVSVDLGVEFVEPEGWLIKEIHSVDVAEGKFFAVLVKILEVEPKLRAGKTFEIPQE